jgi:hypothetical protein
MSCGGNRACALVDGVLSTQQVNQDRFDVESVAVKPASFSFTPKAAPAASTTGASLDSLFGNMSSGLSSHTGSLVGSSSGTTSMAPKINVAACSTGGFSSYSSSAGKGFSGVTGTQFGSDEKASGFAGGSAFAPSKTTGLGEIRSPTKSAKPTTTEEGTEDDESEDEQYTSDQEDDESEDDESEDDDD